MTKNLSRDLIDKYCEALGYKFVAGRAEATVNLHSIGQVSQGEIHSGESVMHRHTPFGVLIPLRGCIASRPLYPVTSTRSGQVEGDIASPLARYFQRCQSTSVTSMCRNRLA